MTLGSKTQENNGFISIHDRIKDMINEALKVARENSSFSLKGELAKAEANGYLLCAVTEDLITDYEYGAYMKSLYPMITITTVGALKTEGD